MYNIARVLDDMGQYDKACRQYTEVCKLNQNNHQSLVNLAVIAQREGKVERVAELLAQAINIKGDSIKVKASLALANSEISAKSAQVAIEAFSKARSKPCKRHTLELLAVLRAYLTWKYLAESQA